jgi:class 3 adenylate cyclase/tetratricopeptide (TPR) repeat protein
VSNAAAKLQSSPTVANARDAQSPAAAAGALPDPSSMSPRKAERRQLTLMFCDLVDSVGLSLRLDPEDLRDVISSYQSACMGPIERYSGHVARYVGDGIVVFFGYPVAHEDDAERAVLAGLEIVQAVTTLNTRMARVGDIDLRVRIGIATGLVVVGDMITQSISEKDAVAGEASNLAARLQTAASPNTVVVSALTRQLAAERFVYRDLGTRELKGFDRPISVYEVVAERTVSRLEARSGAPSPFVGRDAEIDLLVERWQRATSGSGQVVVISGEAGIGKSRVAAEARARMFGAQQATESDSSSVLLFQCSPFHGNAALYPIIRQVEQRAKIAPFDTNQEKLSKLEIAARHCSADDALTLLADLLGLEPSERYPALALAPAARKHLTIEALKDWCASLPTDGAPIIVFEDVHWIDPTSRLLLNRLVQWAVDHPLLIMVTVRAETTMTAEAFLKEAGLVTAGATSTAHITMCKIGELAEGDAKRLMMIAAEGMTIFPLEMDAVLQKSQGNPLYVEELVKGLVRVGDDSNSRADRASSFAVPNSISDALMAQLDQLGPAKEIAQYASVIGQDFSVQLLVKIAGRSLDMLLPYLDRLVEAKLIVTNSATPDAYFFKHALLRDISYQSLLKKSCREIHLRIASELAGRAADAVRATDDLIAQHFSRGEAFGQAIMFWLQGARKAIARSAHEEALGMLESALKDFPKVRGSEEPVSELDLVLAQAMALRSIRGYSAPEVEGRLQRARELCTLRADSSNRFSVEWGLFQCTIVKGDVLGAANIAAGLFEHARRHPHQPFVDAHLASGMVAFHLGHLEEARDRFEQGVMLSSPEDDEPHFFTHGQNPGLFCLSYLARTECFLGYLDRAKATVEGGLSIARRRLRDPGHIYGYVNALTFAARTYQLCGDIESERRLADEIISVSRRNHYAYYEALGVCHRGWAIGAAGALSEGIRQVIDGIAAVGDTGTSLALPGFHLLLAQLYLRAGLFDDANRTLDKAIESRGFGTRVWDAEIERARGDVLALRPAPDMEAAESTYRVSLEIADQQGARVLALKAALSLTELLQRLGRAHECYALLQRCLQQLPEGSDTKHARTAQTVMRSLLETYGLG